MVGLQPICLLYPITYLDPSVSLSVIRACLPLNIWRALLILFSVVGFYASAVVLKNLIEISLLTATASPVYLALMAIFTGSLSSQRFSKNMNLIKEVGPEIGNSLNSISSPLHTV